MSLEHLIKSIRHAPWMFKVIFLLVLGSIVWDWLKRWRRQRLQEVAEDWPSVRGRVISCAIDESNHEGNTEAFLAVLNYSYLEDGQQTGTYERRFESRDEADGWLDYLRDREVSVRFDPVKPSRSTLVERDLPMLPVVATRFKDDSHSPMFSLDIEDMHASGWRPLLAAASLAGLVICALLHLVGLHKGLIGQGAEFSLLFGMQLYTIVVSGAAWMLDRAARSNVSVKRYRAEMDAVTPQILRWIGKLVWLYGIGWFVTTWIQLVGFGGEHRAVPLVMFTAFQAIFLFEAYRVTQMERWRRDASARSLFEEGGRG
jgi:hypothetical protein